MQARGPQWPLCLIVCMLGQSGASAQTARLWGMSWGGGGGGLAEVRKTDASSLSVGWCGNTLDLTAGICNWQIFPGQSLPWDSQGNRGIPAIHKNPVTVDSNHNISFIFAGFLYLQIHLNVYVC